MSSTGSETVSLSNFQLITDGFLRYADITGVELAKDPFVNELQTLQSPDDLLQRFQERENAFKEYRNRNRGLIDCLSPAVRVLQKLSGVFSEVASPVNPVKAIFVGIDVLLEAASEVSSSYDALLDLFECIGNFLKRLEAYTKIPPSQLMTDIIVKIVVELLSVLGLATVQIQQDRLKTFPKKLLGESEVEDALQRIDRLTQDEARMTVAQTLGVIHSLVSNVKIVMEDGEASTSIIRQLVNEMNKAKRDQFQSDVREWLSPPDPSTNHDLVWKAYHSGTAKWFLESTTLKGWKENGSLLWIHGKPGSGKSTLLSAIIQDIHHMRAASSGTMAYYYFDSREVKKQDRYGLLSSLLSQLSAESDTFYDILFQLYLDHAGGTRKPTSSAAAECLKNMLGFPEQGQIYILVDALDESPNVLGTPSAREEVLELIKEIVSLNLPNVHLCVTSCPKVDIRKVVLPLNPLQISLHDEIGQKNDIAEYIKSVVQLDPEMKGWKDEDRHLIIDTLSDKANGMFRWAVCQLDRLRRDFPANIRDILNDLPKNLDETYCHALLGIDEEKREFAQRLFRCLTVAHRPLHANELAELFAVSFAEEGPTTFNPNWRPKDAEEAVLSACSSLVSVDNVAGSRVVQFSHSSVKEFLTSDRLATLDERFSCYHISLEPAHTVLAHASLCVLVQLDRNINRNNIHEFPLALYAARHWVDHALLGNMSSHIRDMMVQLFDPAGPHFSAWVWLYNIDRHWVKPISEPYPTQPEAAPLYYASLSGFHFLVKHLLAVHPQDVNSRGGSHTTPLHAASIKGDVEVASLLLGHGADPNSCDDEGWAPLHRTSRGGHTVNTQSLLDITRLLLKFGAHVDVTDKQGWTPLHTAAANGHLEMVQLLLESGARLNASSETGKTPLFLACSNGKLQVSRLLLEHDADLNSRDKEGSTPLHSASRHGHLETVQMLLKRGADLNVQKADRRTPLHLASRYGHLDVARALLDRGADVNPYQEDRWTPLHLASANGHIDVVKLLIQYRAIVDSRNDKKETPLDRASGAGHLDVARFLIGCGATLCSHDEKGWTPFHSASRNGHLHVVKFLLEHAVDVDMRNENGETALDLASGSGKLDVVRFLIRKGANIQTKDNRGWSPLHTATKVGALNVVQHLINSGIAVDIRNGTQKTPLTLASGKGDVDVSRFLVSQGANLNARDNKGWTPLHLASHQGRLDMTRFLLDSGVDANVQNDNLESPLHLASANGHLKVSRLLLRRNARIDVSNYMRQTPLSRAAANGKVEVARFLITQGANLRITDSNGFTPLHAASQNGHLDVVKLLVGRGANISIVNSANKSPAELASENDKTEVANFLAEYRAESFVQNKPHPTRLDSAPHGADKDGEDKKRPSLHTASEEGKLQVVRLLLERGTNINDKNAHGKTPLDLAATKGNLDIVYFLLERGAEVDSRDKDGWTPLHKASRYGHSRVSRVLINHGAEVDARKQDCWTPIHLSVANGHLRVVELLLKCGADALALNDDGQTPHQLSLAHGHRRIADLLEKHAGRGI